MVRLSPASAAISSLDSLGSSTSIAGLPIVALIARASAVRVRCNSGRSRILAGLSQAETDNSMRGRVALLVVVAIVLAVLAWAWIDGGRQPVREIAIPVAVPESAR